MMNSTTLKNTMDDIPDYVRKRDPEMSLSQMRIYGFTSAVGGTGVSTLATHSAYSLAQRNPMKRVALLSLDFENNSVAYQLHIKPNIPVEYFMQAPAQLDMEAFQSWMCDTPYGFDALALPASLGGNQRVNSDTIIKFLDMASGQYDYLILDIPHIWVPWTHAALGAADKLAMVCELNIPCLHLTREKCGALIKAAHFENGFDILINKFEKKAFRNAINTSDAQKMFPNMPLQTITGEANKVRDALNRGEPLGLTYSGSKVTRDIEEILLKWQAETQLVEQAA